MRNRAEPNEAMSQIRPSSTTSRMLQLPVGPLWENEQFALEIVGHGPVIWFIVFCMSGSEPEVVPYTEARAKNTNTNRIRNVTVLAMKLPRSRVFVSAPDRRCEHPRDETDHDQRDVRRQDSGDREADQEQHGDHEQELHRNRVPA